MKVLFVSSHPLGTEASLILAGMAGWESVGMCMSGKLESFPEFYDLGISFLYHHKIPADQINVPERIWLNFHPAPLPEYRGRNVAYHALMNGEKEFGATLHYVDETFDTGDIIAKGSFVIDEDDTAGDVAREARYRCLDLFREYIPRFLRGEKPMGFRQLGGTYYKKTEIDPYIQLTPSQERQIRAITADPHFAKTKIGNKDYDIRPSE